ncbi:restart primosome assembly protein PriC [Idiomarina fontislapidosi]|uniref:Primosomal replication protein C n=1 Tax=Idiomarina fontislapidosi TaxID=263723 RepID=A0A432XWX5_9GAMM|nr:primosomal replication protein PriC [Idiomarina fontislapidosi]PYE32025.1 restart primosome assembly protein PriC [Idiomarina fontislapidosi]RUO53232.1 hypothetical protein CWE25_08375 [Idiomarina fontislapidosi]|tara:strand:+ start:479 stop:991 length:513 start_codon:yes stop_codon:yes gene_type:complete
MATTSLQQFKSTLALLRQRAQAFDQQKKNKRFAEQWFAENLFTTRSHFAEAYIDETEQLVNKLLTTRDNERKQYLAQRISEQVLSLSSLLQNSRPPDAEFDQRAHQEVKHGHLHRTLAKYRQYEVRLQNKVDGFQKAGDLTQAQAYQKRLSRCQTAINEVEKQIQIMDEG